MPIHLLELSPIALRSLMVGLTYQLGNLGSSASATIQSIIGERYPLPAGPDGKARFNYGKVIAIFMGAVWAFILFFLFWGPEMSQEEREEEAEASLRLEQLRASGISLAEIGEAQFRGK
jgi:SHS family lactate transporter-like MFS transporter